VPRLSTPAMQADLGAYLRWTWEQGPGRFHAFPVMDSV
jgi:hypothetical protein